ncbi:hypothetical protein ES703_52929 [subsurface metagenome]
MTYDSAKRRQCKQLYVEELLDLQDISDQTGVSLVQLYRWRRDENWEKDRDEAMGMRGKLRRLICKLIDNVTEKVKDTDKEIDEQKIYGLVKVLEKYDRLGQVREKLLYCDDAVLLLEAMKEIQELNDLLEDPKILAALEEKLKEKVKK